MLHIPSSEIKQPKLHADTLGFTFVWQGHFLRGIFPQSVEWAKSYFDSGFIDEVVDLGLFPKTWISDFENEQFGMIIEHEMISPVLYATEWNSAMLKDAALMVLEIAEIGWKYGYNMVDCHKLNVMFKDNKPVYVDLGSFVPKEVGSTGWRPYKNFLESYTYILDMWTHGCPQIAKRMMSPGVSLKSENYMAYKHKLYRWWPSLLIIKLKVSKQLNAFAIEGSVAKKSWRKTVCKTIVTVLKLGVSQHFCHLRNSVNKLKVKHDRAPVHTKSFNYSFFSANKSITCFNIGDLAMLTNLAKNGCKIVSINENDTFSNTEYTLLKNITCVSFLLLNGGILIREKFPELRLNSDIVLVRCIEGGHGQFSNHNTLVYLEYCMKYSISGKMYIWQPGPQSEMTKLIKEVFVVEWLSEDETMILVGNKRFL